MVRSSGVGYWLREGIVAILVSLAVFALYMADRDVVQRADSIWTLHVAMSLVHEGNVNLDEIRPLILPAESLTVLPIGEHLYSWFPLGTPLLIAPLLALVDQAAKALGGFDLYFYLTHHRPDQLLGQIELALASGIVALTAGVVYLFGREFLSRGRALLLVFLFAFCTSAWSTAGRALWQHGPSMLLLLLTLFFLVRAKKDAVQAQYAGLFLALAYVVRPNNAIPVLIFSLYVLWVHPRQMARYLLWAAPAAILFMTYNWRLYGSILPPYYAVGRISLHPALAEALLGNLFSPARGLFVYTPLLLLSAFGPYLKRREGTLDRLDIAVVVVVVLHWLVSSSHWLWWAGHSYGPRLFTDMIPFFLYLLIPVIAKLEMPTLASPVQTWLYTLLFGVLTGVSFFMHYQGATQPATIRWNVGFEGFIANVDQDPARVWDWSDPQFWRGLRPAQLRVQPEAMFIQTSVAQAGVQEISLRLYNLGDRPLHWRALAPFGVEFASHIEPGQVQLATSTARDAGPIAGETSQSLTVKVDSGRYAAGTHSLGGIALQPLTPAGIPSKAEPAVIPVSLLVTPQNRKAAELGKAQNPVFLPVTFRNASNQPGLILPRDIFFDGQAAPAHDAELLAIYGAGWHDLEQTTTEQWRWAASPAYLLIRSADSRRVHIRTVVAAVHSPTSADGHGDHGTLRITLDGQQTANGAALAVAPAQPTEAVLDLTPGWNVVRFELAEGSFRPVDLDPATGDSRLLSFALSGINLIPE